MTAPDGRPQDPDAPRGASGIQALVRRLVAEACGMPPEDIEADRPLTDYGLSSRDAVGIAGELEEALGSQLPPTLLWETPSLTALVQRLAEGVPEPSQDSAVGAPTDDPGLVAVVGVGCRLPGGVNGPDAFWDFLLRGGDAIGEVPAERWETWGADTVEAAAALPEAVRRGAFLDDVAAFDAQFFGITPREAQLMDPQQRLLLEVAWEALQHAGMPAPTLRGTRTGVYVGLSSLEYGFLTTADLGSVTEWTATGSAGSIAANRMSYAFDLRGPSLTVDTACSSSLVALHQAVRGLRSAECDTALVAGVNVLLSPMLTASFGEAGVLAPDGRCKPFDAAAGGIVRGEGCGVVVLKRLADAVREGHPVLAVISGTAVNSDGRSAGMVAPNPVAQQELLRSALQDARTAPGELDYVETHGTGTLLGDPIEAGALSAVLAADRPADRPLLIGSVKSNLGHLEGAAGITGLIKTVLSLHHGRIPATLHFTTPNPHIDFAGGRLRVVDTAVSWPDRDGRPVRAGVSAFGFGGTNAHAVLEQWTRPAPPEAPEADTAPALSSVRGTPVPQILVLSERSAERLADTAGGYADWLTGPVGSQVPLADIAFTLGSSRYGAMSAAVVGRDRADLVAGLRALGLRRAAKGVVGPLATPETAEPPGAGPVFVFSGHGSQWAGMGRTLLHEDSTFAAAVHELDPLFADETGSPLSRLLSHGVPLTAVAQVQPVLFGLQLALAATWRAHGVEPAAVIGHSVGEVAAAVVAGALGPVDGLRVVLRRSALLGAVDARRAGAMAAVEMGLADRDEVLGRHRDVGIAVDASPLRCTVAGPLGAVEGLVAELTAQQLPARMLDVGGAGHSEAVDAVLPDLRSALAGIVSREARTTWYGTVHDDPRHPPRADADYWCANARRPVRFRQAVAAAAEDGHRSFLEISPHPVAALPTRETLDKIVDGTFHVLPTLLRDSDEPIALRTTLAALHLAGAQRRPDLLWPAGGRTSLPAPVWRHTRHWVESKPRARTTRVGHPLLGTRVGIPGTGRVLWQGDVGTDGWCQVDQRVDGVPVLPLAVCAELVLSAAAELFGAPVEDIVVRDLTLNRLLPLAGSTPVITQLDPAGPGRVTAGIHTRSAAGTWTRRADATVEVRRRGAREEPAGPLGDGITVPVPPSLQPDGVSTPWRFPPALLDACLRAPEVAARSLETGSTGDTGDTRDAGETRGDRSTAPGVPAGAMPVTVGVLRARRPAGPAGRCRVRPDTAPAGETPSWSVRLENADGAVLLEADGVVLRVPQARELPLPLGDQAYDTVWEQGPRPARRKDAPTDWLLLTPPTPQSPPPSATAQAPGTPADQGSGTGVATALHDALTRAGARVSTARGDSQTRGQVVAAWRANLGDAAQTAAVVLCAGPAGRLGAREQILSAADVVQRLTAAAKTGGYSGSPRLFLVTEGAAPVSAEEEGDPDGGALRGLLRVLALEHPELRPCLIDVDPSPGAADDLVSELLGNDGADHVAWRAGTRRTARLSRVDPGAGSADVPFARADGAYIVTGGLGGLGLATARRLAEHGAGRLVLNGRRPPNGQAEAVLDHVRALGTEVDVVLGDIAEPGTADRLVAAALRRGHTLAGVAHAAGVLRDGLVDGLTAQDLDQVFRPKVDGGRLLDEATAGHDPDWWLVFSSAAALLGSPGQAAYAAANAWLDSLVHRRRARGAAGQSIAWGPWSGVGGAPDTALLALDPITLDDGLDALQLIIAGGRTCTGVVRLDPRRVAGAFPGIELVPFFAGLLDDQRQETGGGAPGPGGAASSDPAAVRQRLASRMAAVMGFAEQEIDPSAPLTELGLDSLMAVRIRNAVTQDFGITLPETLLLRGGSLDEVVAALLSALDPDSAAPADASDPADERAPVDGTVDGTTAAHDTVTADRPAPPDDAAAPVDDPGRPAPAVPVTVQPRDAAERLVAGVWAKLSGQDPDGVRAELPEVRENAELSTAFAAGIRERLGGHRSSPTVEQIRRHPTVSAVADLVRPVLEGGTDGSAPRVLRDPGLRADRPPLFVFHPAGGSTSVYQPLAGLLPPGRPVLGLDRMESLGTVEEKAEHYLTVIRKVQAEGPYHLLGWSFGGCLAYETACRLRERGETVGYLGLIDTILPAALPGPPPEDLLIERFARFAEYVQTAYGRQLRLPYAEMARMGEQEQIDTLMRHVAAGLDMSPGVLEHQRTSYVDARIGERYRPRPYPDPVVLYRAQLAQVLTTAIDPRYLRDDADLGWAPLCPRLEVVPVPGDHLSLIDPPHVDVIARHLRTAVNDG
ncbi:SDR family NAD(P)-dependent oxidoreductase [Streptomyces sp. NBC_01476]|uniref:SDR family NAD(P)-dependent oxidoreductase n=1 Tax=Streptomyces sp. NBC_01476 TaxID=2903881 RepID=UPI002E3378ED|nr:SDR family NAD(P)-dependent oxidoreductase [Streptomyces sp. NBC_01476]